LKRGEDKIKRRPNLKGGACQQIGHWSAFPSMAAAAGAGGLVVWFLLNENKPAKYED
jgi:hypothetical protein